MKNAHILPLIREVSRCYHLSETKGGHGAHIQLYWAIDRLKLAFGYNITGFERARQIAYKYRQQNGERA